MKAKHAVVNTYEITPDIQVAIDAGAARDPAQLAFLSFLNDELPGKILQYFDYRNIFIRFSEVPHLVEDSRSIDIGETGLPNESRTHKHSNTDWRYETRSVKKHAYIDFTYPGIEEIWEDVRGCAEGAAIASVVAAVLAENFAVAQATFYPIFYACLVSKIGDRAKEVGVDYHTTTEEGCWTYHCP